MTLVVHLELPISPGFFEKIGNGPLGILKGLGESDLSKNRKSKISWLCPFNQNFVAKFIIPYWVIKSTME
jgi:hypothetical protein